MTRIRIGFVGAGGIAGLHASKLSTIPEVEIASVADIVYDKAKNFSEKYGGRPYNDWREMYRCERLDAVWICIPPYAHTDEVEEAAENGIHVFVEKPIALTLEKAESMRRAVEGGGVISWVGYHFRQAYSIRRCKNVLDESGPIGIVLGRWWGGIVGDPKHWWWKKELSGGQIVEQATHIFDLARFLIGDVSRIYAELTKSMFTDISDLTIEDAAAVVLRFRSGAIGVITNTCGANPQAHKVEMDIVARKAHIEIRGTKKASIYRVDSVEEVTSLNDPYLDEDLKFIGAIIGRGVSEVPISEGVKTLKLTLAALEAYERMSPIEIE
ncbi:MAG: Gfo/Idh/MocA family oxidoreductase [Candidatus Bathyarchaeota archaeon]|nr:Gfo/Idh/MocA family oxidoreductase [Candidatus Bathyarchaeota archaeon]